MTKKEEKGAELRFEGFEGEWKNRLVNLMSQNLKAVKTLLFANRGKRDY